MNTPDDFDLIPRNRQNAQAKPAQMAGGGTALQSQTPSTSSSSSGSSGSSSGSGYSSGSGGGYGSGSPPPDWSPEPEFDGPPPRRSWGLIVTILGVALLAFGIGAALFTLRDRLNDAPTPTPGPIVTTIIGSDSALITLVAMATLSTTTPVASGTGTATVTPTGTATGTTTPTPTPQQTATPTPCAIPVANGFQEAYRRENFGCATTGAQIVWTAAEPFERGAMLWRSDTNMSYFFTLSGAWQMITAGWDGQSTASRGEPPPGRYTPERGFGWVWATSDPIFDALGWATDIEKGFCAEVQNFEAGFFLQSMSVDSCTAENLYNQATAGDWQPVYLAAHDSGVWSGSLGGTVVASGAPPPATSSTSRPEGQGIFYASRNDAISIDGRMDEWSSSGWTPIANVVEGFSSQEGPRDAVGAFQTAWNNEGLILAVQVQDERFRPGPLGTDLWQGDSIEIQFDGNLSADFSDAMANMDDAQIGVGFREDGQTMQMFRWLPLESHGVLPVIGAGSVSERGNNGGNGRGNDDDDDDDDDKDRGYAFEVMLPWSYLGIATPASGNTYGFNVSINDTDGNKPEQETVISASPARTTYNDPTQWGTLVLNP